MGQTVNNAVSKFKMSAYIGIVIIAASVAYARIENYDKIYSEDHKYLAISRPCIRKIYDLFRNTTNTKLGKINIYCLNEVIYSQKYSGKFDEIMVFVLSIRSLEKISEKCDVRPIAIRDLGHFFAAQIIYQSIDRKCAEFREQFKFLYDTYASGNLTLREAVSVDSTNFASFFNNIDQDNYRESAIFIGYSAVNKSISCVLPSEIFYNHKYDRDMLNERIGLALGKCLNEFSRS